MDIKWPDSNLDQVYFIFLLAGTLIVYHWPMRPIKIKYWNCTINTASIINSTNCTINTISTINSTNCTINTTSTINSTNCTINTISTINNFRVNTKVLIGRSSHKNRNSKKESQFSIIFVLASQYRSQSVLLNSAYIVLSAFCPWVRGGCIACRRGAKLIHLQVVHPGQRSLRLSDL